MEARSVREAQAEGHKCKAKAELHSKSDASWATQWTKKQNEKGLWAHIQRHLRNIHWSDFKSKLSTGQTKSDLRVNSEHWALATLAVIRYVTVCHLSPCLVKARRGYTSWSLNRRESFLRSLYTLAALSPRVLQSRSQNTKPNKKT